jgi:hypothetical protein
LKGSHNTGVSTRYGEARVFFLDDEIYMEPAGAWTRGNSRSRFHVMSGPPGSLVPIDVQAGPVSSQVEWQSIVADRRRSVGGERRRFEVVTDGVIELRASGLFRPVDHDPGTDDRRRLGVRLEFPGPAEAVQYRKTPPKYQPLNVSRPASNSSK